MTESNKSVSVTYDPETDLAYIYLQPILAGGVEYTIPVEVRNGNINIDIDHTGKIVGIEVLGAGALLPERFLLEQRQTRT